MFLRCIDSCGARRPALAQRFHEPPHRRRLRSLDQHHVARRHQLFQLFQCFARIGDGAGPRLRHPGGPGDLDDLGGMLAAGEKPVGAAERDDLIAFLETLR